MATRLDLPIPEAEGVRSQRRQLLIGCRDEAQVRDVVRLGAEKVLEDLLCGTAVGSQVGQSHSGIASRHPERTGIRVVRDGEPALAERFELFINCVEIANGYNELCDSYELKHRFELDNKQRKQANLPMINIDEDLIAALASGLPACAGVALGVDRLLMVIANSKQIQDVLAFPYSDHDSYS